MEQESQWRASRVRAGMDAERIDALLSFAAGWRRENVRYLTGARLRGAFSFAYLGGSGSVTAFVGSGSDEEATQEVGWVDDVRRLEFPDCSEIAAMINADPGARRVGVAHLELMPAALVESVRGGLQRAELVSATRLMDKVRLVKSDWELERVRRAGEVCSAGWDALVGALEPKVREFEVVAAVEAELKRLGAEDNFMLFASGGKEVMGMTPPGARVLRPGDMVRTELTPQLGGYYAQICRSAVLGEPDEGQQRSFELFKEALEAGLGAVRAGVTAHDIARAENDVFREHGYGEFTTSQYTRVRGHGHGLHPDEVPSLLEGEETVIEEGSVIIVHPNTYTPLAGYQVLGDPVVVTKDGYELLLGTERKLYSAPV
ncbi:MAG: M24 family metallopeptidase [Acidimicrobiales bacterium]